MTLYHSTPQRDKCSPAQSQLSSSVTHSSPSWLLMWSITGLPCSPVWLALLLLLLQPEFWGWQEGRYSRDACTLPRDIRLLDQWTPRGWNVPWNLLLGGEKGLGASSKNSSSRESSHRSDNLPDHHAGYWSWAEDGSVTGRTTPCPGMLSYSCLLSLF